MRVHPGKALWRKWDQIRSQVSLRARLGVVFTVLVVASGVCAGVFFFHQNRVALNAGAYFVKEFEEGEKTWVVRQALTKVDRLASAGADPGQAAAAFRAEVGSLRHAINDTIEIELLNDLSVGFEAYMATLGDPGVGKPSVLAARAKAAGSRRAFDRVLAMVSAVVEHHESEFHRIAENLRTEQESAMKVGLFVLSAFILIIALAALKMISLVTKPLSLLGDLLDRVDFDQDDLPGLGELHSNLPEARSVAASFERLLERLRGYRALNVRRLLTNKRRTDVIAASISDGILLLSGTRLCFVNPVGERLLGVSGGGWRQWNTLDQFGDSPGAAAVGAAMSQALPVEFVLHTEGRKSHYLLHSSPISDEVLRSVGGELGDSLSQVLDKWEPNVIVIAQDITYMREAEEAKGHFIGTLSHEIKTPITSLTMATRLLGRSLDQIPGERQKILVRTCADEVDRLRRLLDDLLSVSGFDTLTQGLVLREVDLIKLVRQSIQAFRLQASEREVTVQLDWGRAEAKDGLVSADASKLSWALSNLLTNALRHSPRGGHVDVTIAMEQDFAEIRIRDSGPGIDDARQKTVFEKFSQRYDLRVGRSGASGTGLAIAREIVSAHGGRIWVSSAQGVGAEFGFCLPRSRGAKQEFTTRKAGGRQDG